MSTYRIYLAAEASTSVEVEADDLDSAIDKAYEQNTLYTNIGNDFELGDAEALLHFSTVDGESVEPNVEEAVALRTRILEQLEGLRKPIDADTEITAIAIRRIQNEMLDVAIKAVRES